MTREHREKLSEIRKEFRQREIQDNTRGTRELIAAAFNAPGTVKPIDTLRTVEAPPEPNIVFCRESPDNYFCVEAGANRSFREGDGAGSVLGLVAQFRNEPKPPQRMGKATGVHACIFFHQLDDPEEQDVVGVRIEEPYWVNEPTSVVSFDVGQAHHLLLAIFWRGPQLRQSSVTRVLFAAEEEVKMSGNRLQ